MVIFAYSRSVRRDQVIQLLDFQASLAGDLKRPCPVLQKQARKLKAKPMTGKHLSAWIAW
jgi:hypothetical protein